MFNAISQNKNIAQHTNIKTYPSNNVKNNNANESDILMIKV